MKEGTKGRMVKRHAEKKSLLRTNHGATVDLHQAFGLTQRGNHFYQEKNQKSPSSQ